MLRSLLKFALAFPILIALCIGIIRAQPYDDGGLRDFLFNSPGCESIPDDEPCFMGIRFGVTTFDQALAILNEHEWAVDPVPVSNISAIHWSWSDSRPSFISSMSYGNIDGGSDSVEITHIRLETTISATELFLVLGPSDVAIVSQSPYGAAILISQLYFDEAIIANGSSLCPRILSTYWNSSILLQWDTMLDQVDRTSLTTWGEILPSEWCS